MNYYNDNNPDSVAWMKRLILAGLIPQGDIDDRSIADITGTDLKGYTQCHFFAGIGGWAEALRIARFPVDRKVWTGSCPCQPFSVAGRQKKEKDERHLWPEFRRLISESKPDLVFGEQVGSNAGRDWLSGVQLDVEALGFAFGAADLCAAGIGEDGEIGIVRGGEIKWQLAVIGAPHIRQRLWWVADSRRECNERWGESGVFSGTAENTERKNLDEGRWDSSLWEWERRGNAVTDCCATCGQSHSPESECQPVRMCGSPLRGIWTLTGKSEPGAVLAVENRGSGLSGGVGDTKSGRRQSECGGLSRNAGEPPRRDTNSDHKSSSPIPTLDADPGLAHSRGFGWKRNQNLLRSNDTDTSVGNKEIPDVKRIRADFWSGFDLIPCLDNKARRIESFSQSMVDGLPERLGRVRDQIAEEIEKEIINHGKNIGINPGEVLRGLWVSIQKKTESLRIMGERAMLYEEAILFNILLKLKEQGWALAEGLSCESEKVAREALRVLRYRQATPGSPCRSGLDEQRAGKSSDPMHILSSLLARHAYQAWIEAERANTEACFPLTHRNENRTLRLKGYGNAIIPQVAATFIRAWMEVSGWPIK